MVTEPYDVAIRVGELPSSTLIARQLALLKAQVFASPRYLERAGEVMAYSLFLVGPLLYLLPTYEAWRRRHRSLLAIGFPRMVAYWLGGGHYLGVHRI